MDMHTKRPRIVVLGGGFAFVAQPQILPRNLNWSASGFWVHYAKIAFEKYFLLKIRRGEVVTPYERAAFKLIGIDKLKEPRRADTLVG